MLLKQDKSEAVMAVDGRLEFIEKEMYGSSGSWRNPSCAVADLPYSKRVEKQIGEIQEKSEKKKMEVGFSLYFSVEASSIAFDIMEGIIALAAKEAWFLDANGAIGRFISYRIAYSSNSKNHK